MQDRTPRGVRVTIYADSLDDAVRALGAVRQEARERPEGRGPRARDGALWSGREDDWHALVWGGPAHYRVDSRRQDASDAG